eukprot:Em0012g415a
MEAVQGLRKARFERETWTYFALLYLHNGRGSYLDFEPLGVLCLVTSARSKANSDPYPFDVSSRNCTAVSKWIVTTSSTGTPSAGVRVILNSTENWCLLVLGKVAGLKYDFSWTKGTTHLIYLPLEALSFLPYKLTKLTSLDVKNIGYLYAIANGARVVLDLEDGIVPIPIGRTYLPLQNDKREYRCPSLEEKEVTGHTTESPSYGDELPLYTNSSQVVNLLKYHLMSFDTFEEALLSVYKLMYQSQILADIVHIPNQYASDVTRVLKHVNSVTELFCEIAVPLAVDIAQPIGREEMEDGNLWEWQRTESPLVQSFVEARYYMHAMKMSTRYGADIWCKSMNNQLRLLA